MSNPYQSPQSSFDSKLFQDPPPGLIGGSEYGWIQQVRVYAILSAFQAALELPMGALLLFVGSIVPVMMTRETNDPPPQEVVWGMMGYYLTEGCIVLLSAVLRLVAAYRNFYFKSRALGFLAMGLGLASMFACYCAPTTIAIFIYGLIVFRNPAVKVAFEMGAQGRTPAEIFAAFTPYRTYSPPPPAT